MISIFPPLANHHYCSAEPVLIISGPTEVFEQSQVTFTVTLDGTPVQARVVFGDGLQIRYSNSTTGEVLFTTPAVSTDSSWFVVTASVAGSIYAYHSILVRNRTNILDIHLSTNSPNELESFTVTITNQGTPVSDASVWFHNTVQTTNTHGQVVFTAPDVLVTTSMGLSVNKTGFSSRTQMVTIKNTNQGLQFMQIIIPMIVEPGQHSIPVHVVGLTGGIDHAEVNVSYEGIHLQTVYTNQDGYALINAPIFHHTDFFSVSVRKQGYRTLQGVQTINLTLFERTLEHDLIMTLFPSEVIEGDTVTVQITDAFSRGVSGVSLWRDGNLLESTTDAQGMAILVTPSVYADHEIYIYGIMQGYNFVQGSITVRNRIQAEDGLQIRVTSTIHESTVFSVILLDSNSQPVTDVLVTFNQKKQKSDANGIVSFIAPAVVQNTVYTIYAEKAGYLPASISVEIINTTTSYGDTAHDLVILVIPVVLEHEQFQIIVKDAAGLPVSAAQIRFLDTVFTTDAFGTVVLTAPAVDSDQVKTIVAFKAGYHSTQQTILIKNSSEFPYWFLVVIIIGILSIGIIVYLRFNRLS
ncbi:MAG: hypothetical protein QXL17_04150 [Candidatus Thermoplasmatota archaeon]